MRPGAAGGLCAVDCLLQSNNSHRKAPSRRWQSLDGAKNVASNLLPFGEVVESVGRVDVQCKKNRPCWPLDPAYPPANFSAPAGLGPQYPITASLIHHHILDEPLVLNPERQFITIKMAASIDLTGFIEAWRPSISNKR